MNFRKLTARLEIIEERMERVKRGEDGRSSLRRKAPGGGGSQTTSLPFLKDIGSLVSIN